MGKNEIDKFRAENPHRFNILSSLFKKAASGLQSSGMAEHTRVEGSYKLKTQYKGKESDKEVLRAAEHCATVLAEALGVEQSVKVINPIILTGDFPVNQAAVKMLTKVMEIIQ